MGQRWSQSNSKEESSSDTNQVVTVHPPPSSSTEHSQSPTVKNRLRETTTTTTTTTQHPLLQQLEQLDAIHPLQQDNSNEIRLIQETKQLADMAIVKRFYSGNTVGLKGLLSSQDEKRPISFHSPSLHEIAAVKRHIVQSVTTRQEQLQAQADRAMEKTKQVQQQLENKADQLRRVSTGIRQIEKLLITLCDCQELLARSLELTVELSNRATTEDGKPICSFREYLHLHAPDL